MDSQNSAAMGPVWLTGNRENSLVACSIVQCAPDACKDLSCFPSEVAPKTIRVTCAFGVEPGAASCVANSLN